jgi:hypothetical protein
MLQWITAIDRGLGSDGWPRTIAVPGFPNSRTTAREIASSSGVTFLLISNPPPHTDWIP